MAYWAKMTNYFMNLMVKSRVRGRQGFTYMMMHLTCWNMQVCKDLFFKYRIFLSVESMIHDFLKIEFEHFFSHPLTVRKKGWSIKKVLKYKNSQQVLSRMRCFGVHWGRGDSRLRGWALERLVWADNLSVRATSTLLLEEETEAD